MYIESLLAETRFILILKYRSFNLEKGFERVLTQFRFMYLFLCNSVVVKRKRQEKLVRLRLECKGIAYSVPLHSKIIISLWPSF